MSNVQEKKEAHIFISYSHKDADKVLPVIEGLIMRGFRVWYDDNIESGSDWSEELALHIEECGCFMPFLSENYLASMNCIGELEYALNHKVTTAPVYLTNCRLGRKYEFKLSGTQAVERSKWKTPEDILNRLCRSKPVVWCKEGINSEEALQAELAEQARKNNKRQMAALRRKAAREEKRAEEERKKQERLQNAKREERKKRGCGCLFWVVVLLLIAGWFGYRWLCFAEKNIGFAILCKYEDASDYMTYLDMEVANNSLLDVEQIKGRLEIFDRDGVRLMSMDYTLTSETQANRTTTYDLDFEESDTVHFEQLYNSSLDDLKVTFQLSSVTYEGGKLKEYDRAKVQVLHDVTPLDEMPSSDPIPTNPPPTSAPTNFDGEIISDPVPSYVRRQFDDAMTAFDAVAVYSETAESDFLGVAEMFDAIWDDISQSDILKEEMYRTALTYKAYEDYVRAYIMFSWLSNISYKDSESHMNTCYYMVESGL